MEIDKLAFKSDEKILTEYYLDLFVLIFGGVLFFFYPLFYFVLITILSPYLKTNTRRVTFLFCFTVAVTFYASLKPFSDLAEYLNVYHQLESGLVNVFFYDRFGYGIEFFSLILMKLIGSLTDYNDQALLLSIYTLIFYLIYKISISISAIYYGLIFGAFFFSLLFLESASYFVRQNLSVLFFMLAIIKPISTKRKVALMLLSVFCHISGAVNIVVYIFSRWYGKKINTPQRIVKVMMITLTGLVLSYLFFSYTTFGRVLLDKAVYVVNNHSYATLPIMYVLLVTINVVFIIFLNIRYSVKNIVIYYLLIKELIVFYLFLPFPAVPNRLGMILFSYAPFFVMQIFKDERLNFKRYKLGVSFIIISIIPFMYSMSVISSGLNKYTFYLNNPFTTNILDVSDYLYSSIINGIEYVDKGNAN